MNARDNPFATDRLERLLAFRPEWIDTDWPSIHLRWQELGNRASVTGRHGSGKTTFLGTFARRLADSAQEILHFFLNRDQSSLSANEWSQLAQCSGKTVLLDGEEQLGFLERRRFYQITRASAALIVTRHKPGQLPTLLHFNPGIETIHRCVRELSPEFYPQLKPLLGEMWKNKQGNLRSILLDCYDAVARINPDL